MLQIKAKILYNKRVKDNYFHLVLEAPRINKKSLPGQFLNIKVNAGYEPLLRRPFSIHRAKGINIEILYAVVGNATEILSHRKSGEYLDAIGPLGNGFNYRLPITDYRVPILVSGGMGVAPLLFLADRLAHSPQTNAQRKILVLLGAKTRNQILCAREFKQLGCNVKVSTDDGTRDFKGKVTDLLIRLLSTIDYGLSAIYACGPRPMLKETSRISKEYKIPAQLSLEEHMACGIGACLGCAVNTKEGFQRVCKEGPVFNAEEISWK